MKRHAIAALAVAPVALWAGAHLRAPAVRAWRRPELPVARVGRLSCRSGGSGPTAAMLLHGLVATGDVFGQAVDNLAARHLVAVPDLLGFGRSLDERASDFGTGAHLEAIDTVVDTLFGDRPIVLGAHSMGSTLALRWAVENPGRVSRIACIGAPMWESSASDLEHLGHSGAMARVLLHDEAVARHLCALNCAHRNLSGWIAALVAPRWPIPIARQASLHTWAAFRQAVDQQILHNDWRNLLGRLDAQGVSVHLIWGDHDSIGDPGYGHRMAAELRHLSIEVVPQADHTLPAALPHVLPNRLCDDE